MHEMHLIKDLADDLLKFAKEQDAKKITAVYIQMGEFTEINPEILMLNLCEKLKGTIGEGAKIVIKPSKVRELRLVSFDCE